MNIRLRIICLLAGFVPLATTQLACGFESVIWTGAASTEWTDPNNWNHPLGAFIPEGRFDDVAFITNGTLAEITSSLVNGPGDIVVNNVGSEVRVTNTGAVTMVEPAVGSTVFRTVFLGEGTFTVQGAGTVVGAGLAFAPESTLGFDLTDSTTTPITIENNITLEGTVRVDFSGLSSAPSSGQAFTLVDSIGGIAGDNTVGYSFSGLAPGQISELQVVPGGQGNLLQSVVINQLLLELDRDTSIATIRNISPEPITFDGFSVESALGSMDPTAVTSLGAGWTVPPGNNANALGQINETSSTTLAAGASVAIGSIYDLAPAPAFGIDLEDHTFTFTSSQGSIGGAVQYVGDKVNNTVVLKVDPNSGEAAIINESVFAQNLEAFTITSASGSLDPNSSTGVSGAWTVSGSSDANRLTQLQEDGTTLFNNTTQFDIGTIYSGGADPNNQDFVFEFLLAGSTELLEGVVVFGDITSPSIPGDFNNDGQVDSDDLNDPTVGWIDRYGTDLTGLDFLIWQENFGTGVPFVAAVTAVPEAASLWLMAIGVPFVTSRRRRSDS